MDSEIWPLWGVRLRTERLELRPVREADALALVELSRRGIHDPDTMPFNVPWTDEPPPAFERSTLQFFHRCTAEFSTTSWRIPFAAWLGETCVGLQDVAAEEFPRRGVVETGSWLGRQFQGSGLGKEMRAAILAFAFEGLGARRAETGAFDDNAASLGVTSAMGYRPNGDAIAARRDGSGRQLRFVMDLADWERSPAGAMQVHVEGVTAQVLAQFGLG